MLPFIIPDFLKSFGINSYLYFLKEKKFLCQSKLTEELIENKKLDYFAFTFQTKVQS